MEKQITQKGNRVKPASAPKLTIAAAARRLAVTREHLSRVLHGHRQSRRLLRDYADLQRQHAEASKSKLHGAI